MKFVAKMIVALLLLQISIVVLADQKEKRIRFERGRTSAIAKGAVTNSEQENYHAYRLRVGKGQKLIVHLASPIKAARFLLTLPDDSTADNGSGEAELKDWEGAIPASGDIVITIYHKGSKALMPYTLEVTVR
jgi:hypothetical protein